MQLNAGLKNSFVKGALTVSLGGLIAKLLGALYRIPLTNILKADGLGVYQTVFPVYALLLTFSSSGVPSAISKLVSSGEDGEKILARALSFFMHFLNIIIASGRQVSQAVSHNIPKIRDTVL